MPSIVHGPNVYVQETLKSGFEHGTVLDLSDFENHPRLSQVLAPSLFGESHVLILIPDLKADQARILTTYDYSTAKVLIQCAKVLNSATEKILSTAGFETLPATWPQNTTAALVSLKSYSAIHNPALSQTQLKTLAKHYRSYLDMYNAVTVAKHAGFDTALKQLDVPLDKPWEVLSKALESSSSLQTFDLENMAHGILSLLVQAALEVVERKEKVPVSSSFNAFNRNTALARSVTSKVSKQEAYDLLNLFINLSYLAKVEDTLFNVSKALKVWFELVEHKKVVLN